MAVRRTVGKVQTRTPGQRAGLSREAVLAAARDLLAGPGGLDGLSMRALARALGVAPNALYSHVAGREALLDAVLDDVLGEVGVPGAGDTADDLAGDPVDALGEVMTSTYAVLRAHRDLVPLYLARQGARGPQAVRLGEVVDALLQRAGVAQVGQARRVIVLHAIGSAALGGGEDLPLSDDEADRTFAAGLRWLLTGITRGA